MGFKRYEGLIASELQKKGDTKLPKCPFCGDYPHWLLELDFQQSFSIQTVTYMCEKCSGKLYMERNGVQFSNDLRVVDLGIKNINNLQLNGNYNIIALKSLGESTLNENVPCNTKEVEVAPIMVDRVKTNNNKMRSGIIGIILGVFALILFFATDCSAMVFNNREYKAYKYAIECVEDELKFPSEATYPSFRKTTIKKSEYSTAIILGAWSGGKSYKYAWDIRGNGTCENALGMEINYTFTATIVLDEYGDYWCYQCTIN